MWLAWLPTDVLEKTTCQNLPIRLDGDSLHNIVRARIERIGLARHSVEPGHVNAHLSADVEEIAARYNFPVRLERDGIDSFVRVRIEGGVEGAVRVQPGNAVPRDRRSAVWGERGKIAAEKNLPVRLDHDHANGVVCVGIETIERGLSLGRCCYCQKQQQRAG